MNIREAKRGDKLGHILSLLCLAVLNHCLGILDHIHHISPDYSHLLDIVN